MLAPESCFGTVFHLGFQELWLVSYFINLPHFTVEPFEKIVIQIFVIHQPIPKLLNLECARSLVYFVIFEYTPRESFN